MPQFGRPSADTDNTGGWQNQAEVSSNIYQSIDESVSDDTDYIQSPFAPVTAAYTTRLTSLIDPVSSTGHILRSRVGKSASGGDLIDMVLQLRQGYVNESTQGTLLLTRTFTNVVTPPVTETYTLSGAEADAITDYTSLFTRWTANQTAAPTALFWDEASSWPELGRVPLTTDDAVIPAGRTIVLRTVQACRSLAVSGTLLVRNGLTTGITTHGGNGTPSVGGSWRVTSTGRVASEDGLPLTATSLCTLQALNVSDTNFVGSPAGGTHLTDTGLWIEGGGVWELEGAPKLGWARATGALLAGGTSVTLDATPTGWRVGDEIVVAVTLPPGHANFLNGYDERTILTVAGNTITVAALTFAHPGTVVNGVTRYAEVANLTRNVRILGTGTSGRIHTIHTSPATAQQMRYIELRYMGPRTAAGNDVTGRWAVHLHELGTAMAGRIFLGLVARDVGTWGFTTHASHSMTFEDCVGYNGREHFRWDSGIAGPGGPSFPENLGDSITYDHCLAMRSDSPGGNRRALFTLQRGTTPTNVHSIIDSAAVGMGQGSESSGMHWPEGDSGIWAITDCVVHNCGVYGIFSWWNTGAGVTETSSGAVVYNCRRGWGQGAYAFSGAFGTVFSEANEITGIRHVSAGASPSGLTFTGGRFVGTDYGLVVDVDPVTVAGSTPAVYSGCTFSGGLASLGFLITSTATSLIDLTGCTLSGSGPDFLFAATASTNIRVRVRTSSGSVLTSGQILEIRPNVAPWATDGAFTTQAAWNARIRTIADFTPGT